MRSAKRRASGPVGSGLQPSSSGAQARAEKACCTLPCFSLWDLACFFKMACFAASLFATFFCDGARAPCSLYPTFLRRPDEKDMEVNQYTGKVQQRPVHSMSWHPLGHCLASGSRDQTVKFWCRRGPGADLLAAGSPSGGASDGAGQEPPAFTSVHVATRPTSALAETAPDATAIQAPAVGAGAGDEAPAEAPESPTQGPTKKKRK